MEQANDVQEALGRSYNLPDEIDEDDLEAGLCYYYYYYLHSQSIHLLFFGDTCDSTQNLHHILPYHFLELDALGDELNFEEEETPSYLQEDVPEMPGAVQTEPKEVCWGSEGFMSLPRSLCFVFFSFSCASSHSILVFLFFFVFFF